jgi:hypothetical protein
MMQDVILEEYRMTHWIMANIDWLKLSALASGAGACIVAIFRKPSAHTILWLIGILMWTAAILISKVMRSTFKHGEILPSWFLPTTMGLAALSVLVLIAGSVVFAVTRTGNNKG